ncbi:hypothetical protein MUO65_04425, partial [bacterium]|nr:hypothetical protein [bacterium]
DNLNLLRRIYRNEDFFKWVATILLHDIGRFKEFYDPMALVHEKVSFDLINRLNLLRELNDRLEKPLSDEAINIIPSAIRYHTFFAGERGGEFSLIKIGQMLSDPYLRKVLSDGKGKIDREKLRAFLEELALLSTFDASGAGGKGMALNPSVEYFIGMAHRIGDIAKHVGYDWNKTVAVIMRTASKHVDLRISGLLSLRDRIQDNVSTPRTLGSFPTIECYEFYSKKFSDGLTDLLAADKLFMSWLLNRQAFYRWFEENYTHLAFRYLNYLVAHLAWIEEGVDFSRMPDQEITKYFQRQYEVKKDYKVNPNAIKLLLLLTTAARATYCGMECDEVIICGEKGERIDHKDDFHDYVISLNGMLTQTRDVHLYLDGNIYFVNEKGENIDGAVMIKETIPDGTRRLILKISRTKPKRVEVPLPERPMTVEETKRAVKNKLREKGWQVPDRLVEGILTKHAHPEQKVFPNEKRIERLAKQVWLIYSVKEKKKPIRRVLVHNVYEKEGAVIEKGAPEDFTEVIVITPERAGILAEEARKIADFGGFVREVWYYTEKITGEQLAIVAFEIHKPFDPKKPTEGSRFDVDFVANQYILDKNTRVFTVKRDFEGRPILRPFEKRIEKVAKKERVEEPAKKPWWKRYAKKVKLHRAWGVRRAILAGLKE